MGYTEMNNPTCVQPIEEVDALSRVLTIYLKNLAQKQVHGRQNPHEVTACMYSSVPFEMDVT